MNKMDEMIIVAPRDEVFDNELLVFQGVNSDKIVLEKVVQNIDHSFSVMRRGDAEENVHYKQPIPYAVLKRGNDVFIYERLQGGGESRLHNQLSLGVGGHMNNFETSNFSELVMENLIREITEELHIENNGDNLQLNTIGLINDDENEVGKVHLGLLVVAELEGNSKVIVRETDQLKGGWIQIKSLTESDIYDNLESWSKFVADILNK